MIDYIIQNIKKNNKRLNIFFYLSIIFIIIIGIFIRVKFYLADIPMWLDELMLASNFTDKSFSDIFSPSNAFQKFPPFFFLSVIILKKIFGAGELVLRFIPFILNIASLFLFFLLLKKTITNKTGIFVGMFMFTFCVPFIYFCAEFKPYGCDVFFSILLLLIYKYLDFSKLNIKQIIIYNLGAIFFVYFSFPAIFIISAVILANISKNNKFNLKSLWILIGVFLAGIYLFLYDLNTYVFLKEYWNNVEGGFNLFPSLKFIWTFIHTGCQYYIYNFNSLFIPVIVGFILTGLVVMHKQDKTKAKIFILIFVLALIASLLNAYPLKPKLALYMLPVFILLISKVFDMNIYLKLTSQKFIFNIFTCLLLLMVTGINIPYINMSENNLVYYNKSSNGRNKSVEDRTKVKEYSLEIIKNFQAKDVIFASEEFVYSLKYYNCRYKFNKNLKIIPFADTPASNVSNEDMTELVENTINKNEYSGYWFIGRNDELYFKSLNFEETENIVKQHLFKYKIYKQNDLFLIYAKAD